MKSKTVAFRRGLKPLASILFWVVGFTGTGWTLAASSSAPSVYTAYTVIGPLQTATTNTVTVGGIGFVPQSVVLANGSPVSSTYTSGAKLVAQIPVSASAKGTVPIT